MIQKVIKAVIPVAGLGTRMLPATKAIPKELLPVYDRPIIETLLKKLFQQVLLKLYLLLEVEKKQLKTTLTLIMSLSID